MIRPWTNRLVGGLLCGLLAALVTSSIYAQDAQTFSVRLQASTGRYLSIDKGTVVANQDQAGNAETFDIIRTGDGKVALRSQDGKVVSVSRSWSGDYLRLNGSTPGPSETFNILVQPTGLVAFQTFDGKFLAVRSDRNRVFIEDTVLSETTLFAIESRTLRSVQEIVSALSSEGAIQATRSFITSGAYPEARAVYEKLPATAFTDDDRRGYATSIIQTKGDTLKAITLLKQVLVNDPEKCDVRTSLAELLGDRSDYRGVVDLLSANFDRCPDTTRAHLYRSRGIAYDQIDSTLNAIRDYNLAIGADSSISDTYEKLMTAYQSNDESGKAADVARIVLNRFTVKTNPYIVGVACYFLADDEIDREQYQQALHDLTEGIRISPKDVELHVKLGDCYDGMDDTAKACEAYSRALELDPGNENATSNLSGLGCVQRLAATREAVERDRVGFKDFYLGMTTDDLKKVYSTPIWNWMATIGDVVTVQADGLKAMNNGIKADSVKRLQTIACLSSAGQGDKCAELEFVALTFNNNVAQKVAVISEWYQPMYAAYVGSLMDIVRAAVEKKYGKPQKVYAQPTLMSESWIRSLHYRTPFTFVEWNVKRKIGKETIKVHITMDVETILNNDGSVEFKYSVAFSNPDGGRVVQPTEVKGGF